MQKLLVRTEDNDVVAITEIILHSQFALHIMIQQTEVEVAQQLAGVVTDGQSRTITTDNAHQGLHHRLVLDFAAEASDQHVLVDGVIEFLDVEF